MTRLLTHAALLAAALIFSPAVHQAQDREKGSEDWLVPTPSPSEPREEVRARHAPDVRGAMRLVEGDDLIAFCRPAAWAAKPCFCSVEQVETMVTPGQFILHMRERLAVGSTSAAELRAAETHAREICGEGGVAASLDAFGAAEITINSSQRRGVSPMQRVTRAAP
ncbi:hypothetical protein [Falsiroseomonas sp. HW251]|uniref:hypothetical protein n=1 Tax=Falsiroseomonas sp. HW251 TaxID=3390998 RepID=UPI003D31AE0E